MELLFLMKVFFVIFVIFLYLFTTSARFKYYAIPFIYIGFVSIVSTICIPYALLDPGNVLNAVYSGNLCKHVARFMSVKYTIRGKEYLAREEPCVYVANHQSYLDGLGMFTIWNIVQKCSPVARKEMLYCGPSGIISWLSGFTFIDKSNTNKAKEQLNVAFKKLIAKKIKIWIYPEGTRRATGEIHQFKKGAFNLAVGSRIPIVPVVFSQYYFVNWETKEYKGGEVIITALPPISTEKYNTDNIDELIQTVHSEMNKVFHKVNMELTKSSIK